MSKGRRTVALWGHFADANLGDDACPTAVLHNFRSHPLGPNFALICRFPHIAEANYGLPAYPVTRIPSGRAGPWHPPAQSARQENAPHVGALPADWRAPLRRLPLLRAAVQIARTIWRGLLNVGPESRFLWQSYRILRSIDLLIVAGSTPIFDYFGGYWGYPVTVWKWATLTRLAGTKLAFASVGAGPIVSARSGRLLARALRKADYVSFRDQRSRRLMERHGYTGPAFVRPDLAHSLPRPAYTPPAARSLRIGINPMIVHNPVFWPGSDISVYHRYVNVLAALVVGLQQDGVEVFLYGTQKDDGIAAADVQDAVRQVESGAKIPGFTFPKSVADLVKISGDADALVTTRFHGAVFGVLACTPTVAICYQEKTKGVAERAGLDEFAFSFEEASAEGLREALDHVIARRAELAEALRRHAAVNRAQLDEQYRWLAELLEPA